MLFKEVQRTRLKLLWDHCLHLLWTKTNGGEWADFPHIKLQSFLLPFLPILSFSSREHLCIFPQQKGQSPHRVSTHHRLLTQSPTFLPLPRCPACCRTESTASPPELDLQTNGQTNALSLLFSGKERKPVLIKAKICWFEYYAAI